MPIAFYIVPYTRTNEGVHNAGRRLALDSDFPELHQTPGQEAVWHALEVRGNRALVKIRERDAVLAQLDAVYYRLPVDDMASSLSGIGVAAELDLETELLGMGYTALEIATTFPSGLTSATLREVARFMASRVFDPRYDSTLDLIVLDQDERDNRSQVDGLDGRVT